MVRTNALGFGMVHDGWDGDIGLVGEFSWDGDVGWVGGAGFCFGKGWGHLGEGGGEFWHGRVGERLRWIVGWGGSLGRRDVFPFDSGATV